MNRFLIVCLTVMITMSVLPSVSSTLVSVVSPSPVFVGDNFTVAIYCSPTQPVKSFEMTFHFDGDILQASSVTEGNIFNGFETLFSSGIINNTSWNITQIYGLILGQGNVTDGGSFFLVSLHAIEPGNSDLEVFSVGVTNETDYVPFQSLNSSVFIYDCCDVNADGIINLLDLVSISNLYGREGSPGWIPQDVNNDGQVKILDLVLVACRIVW